MGTDSSWRLGPRPYSTDHAGHRGSAGRSPLEGCSQAVAARFVVAGDFRTDRLPDGPFDTVLVSNVLHIYGPDVNRNLMAEFARGVAPGGVLAVAKDTLDFLETWTELWDQLANQGSHWRRRPTS